MDIFGKIVYQNEIDLNQTKLDGHISITEETSQTSPREFMNKIIALFSFTKYQADFRTYLKFTSGTVGLLDCYTKVRLGDSSEIDFENPIDISDIFEVSCHEKRVNISPLSTADERAIGLYTRDPSIHPPPYNTSFEAVLDKEAKTIQLAPTPVAPLTCLNVTVNGEAIQMNSSGSINMTEYFFPCHDQLIQLKVNTDANGTQQDVFSKDITLAKINTLRPLNPIQARL